MGGHPLHLWAPFLLLLLHIALASQGPLHRLHHQPLEYHILRLLASLPA